jgi:hypothetical protein
MPASRAHQFHLLFLLSPVNNLRHVFCILVQLQAQQVLHTEARAHLKADLWVIGQLEHSGLFFMQNKEQRHLELQGTTFYLGGILQRLPMPRPHGRAAQVTDQRHRRQVVLDQQVQALEAVCR